MSKSKSIPWDRRRMFTCHRMTEQILTLLQCKLCWWFTETKLIFVKHKFEVPLSDMVRVCWLEDRQRCWSHYWVSAVGKASRYIGKKTFRITQTCLFIVRSALTRLPIESIDFIGIEWVWYTRKIDGNEFQEQFLHIWLTLAWWDVADRSNLKLVVVHDCFRYTFLSVLLSLAWSLLLILPTTSSSVEVTPNA
jgi:hypothetical protein